MTTILPVVHWSSLDVSLASMDIALEAGAPGVVLINMGGEVQQVLHSAVELRERYPTALVGVNVLGRTVRETLNVSRILGLDATWTDDQMTHTSRPAPPRPQMAPGHLLFCGVAFKGQEHEPDPVRAARTAVRLGMVPTTSGRGTGIAPYPEHVAALREGIGPEAPLAVASGITPENVHLFSPHITHALVATGISRDFHNLDPALTRALVENAR